jgi:indolepyruvate decarboxylase
LGSLIRFRIPALIIVVNNDGYTVERAIHGADKSYNDIAAWRWTDLPHAFGGDDTTTSSARAATAKELAAALLSARDDRLTLIEAVTAALDVPTLLSAVAEAAAGANRSD